MKNTLYKKSIISIQDLSLEEFKLIFAKAEEYKKNNGLPPKGKLPLQNKIISSCFFEASTRTRLSFEAATQRLGGSIIGFADSINTSLGAKGESLKDTLKIIGGYSDLLVLRHPQEGAAQGSGVRRLRLAGRHPDRPRRGSQDDEADDGSGPQGRRVRPADRHLSRGHASTSRHADRRETRRHLHVQ